MFLPTLPAKHLSLSSSWSQTMSHSRKSLLYSSELKFISISLNKGSNLASWAQFWERFRWHDWTIWNKDRILKVSSPTVSYSWGVFTLEAGSLKFAKINFEPEDDALQDILTKKLKFADSSIIIPCEALYTSMQVVGLLLSNLPFLPETELLEGLQRSLCQ